MKMRGGSPPHILYSHNLEGEPQSCVNLPILFIITGQALSYIAIEVQALAQVKGAAHS